MQRVIKILINCGGPKTCNVRGEVRCRDLVQDDDVCICRQFRVHLVEGPEGVERAAVCLAADCTDG